MRNIRLTTVLVWLGLILLLLSPLNGALAGLVSKPFVFSPNTLIQSAQVNGDFDVLYNVINGNLDNTNITQNALLDASKFGNLPDFASVRLTGISGQPIADTVALVPAIFLDPYNGYFLSLYSTSAVPNQFIPRPLPAEISLTLSSLTSNNNYDIYAFWNGSAIALDTPVVWTNDTTPPSRQVINGVTLKGSDATRRLVGSIRAVTPAGTIDTPASRWISNAQNLVPRICKCTPAGVGPGAPTTWSTTAGTVDGSGRFSWLNSTASNGAYTASFGTFLQNAATNGSSLFGIGRDTTATPDANVAYQAYTINSSGTIGGSFAYAPAIGYHFLQTLYGSSGGNATINANPVTMTILN